VPAVPRELAPVDSAAQQAYSQPQAPGQRHGETPAFSQPNRATEHGNSSKNFHNEAVHLQQQTRDQTQNLPQVNATASSNHQ